MPRRSRSEVETSGVGTTTGFTQEDFREAMNRMANMSTTNVAARMAWDTGITVIHDDMAEEKLGPSKVYDPEDIVKLYTGGNEKVKNCVRTIEGYWFKKDNESYTKCLISGDLVYIGNCVNAIASFDENGIPNKVGYIYTKNALKAETIVYKDRDGNTYHYNVDYDMIPKDSYTECLQNGWWYHKNSYPTKLPAYARYRKVNAIKKLDKLTLSEQYKFGVKSPSFKITEGKKYTFGTEHETICGVLPPYLDKELNYEAVHDGSLRKENGDPGDGAEYVSGVLTGDTGFLQEKKLTNQMTNRCKVDKKCGLHVHIGGVTFNKATVVSSYKMFKMIEKELFEMMPPSRRDNQYCRELNNINLKFTESDFLNSLEYEMLIDDYYNKIVNFVSSTEEGTSRVINKKKNHPRGNKCGFDHHTARYCWVNYVPAIFDTRGNGVYTIEFRNHPGTASYIKTKYWILICMGLMWYAENYQKEIALTDKLTLRYIMKLAYPRQGDKLISYIEKRTSRFNSSIASKNKIEEDKDYVEEVSDESLSIKRI